MTTHCYYAHEVVEDIYVQLLPVDNIVARYVLVYAVYIMILWVIRFVRASCWSLLNGRRAL